MSVNSFWVISRVNNLNNVIFNGFFSRSDIILQHQIMTVNWSLKNRFYSLGQLKSFSSGYSEWASKSCSLAESPRTRSPLGQATIAIENGNPSMRRKFGYDVSVRTHARPPVRTGRKVLSRLCRGGDGESKTCSLCLSWRNVNQFTERQSKEFF